MQDPELTDDQRTIIRNTAMAILKNGVSFLEWLMARRKGEGAYAFLFGGKGNAFYNWCLENPTEAANLESVKSHVIDTSLSSAPPRPIRGRSRSRSLSHSCSSSSFSSSSSESAISRRRYRSRSRSRQRSRSIPRNHVRSRRSTPPPRSRSKSPSPARLRERVQRADWVRRRRDERENRRRHEVSPQPVRQHGKMYGWSSSSEGEESSVKNRLLQNH